MLFLLYLAGLTYLLFFAEWVGRTEAYAEYHYNVIPFETIRRYALHREMIGKGISFLNIEGNILAFLPFGFFLPLLFIRFRRLFLTVLMTACFSFCVELLQLVTRVGSCDVDDLILNTIGGLIGYLLFLLFMRLKEKREKRLGKEV